jgi:hypothetical protein
MLNVCADFWVSGRLWTRGAAPSGLYNSLDGSRALLARDKEGEFAAFRNLSNEDTLPGEM